MEIVYVNLETYNSESAPVTVHVDESRDPYFLENPENYMVAIDRWNGHKIWLPVYQNVAELQLRVRHIGTDAYNYAPLDFTPVEDANHLLWDKSAFINVLNTALSASCVTLGVPLAEVPEFFLNLDNTITFDYEDHANFATKYEVSLNEELYSIMSALPYDQVAFDQKFFVLNTTDAAPYQVTSTEAIELNPVAKIFIKSPSIPLVYEFTPTIDSARASEAILTDFEYSSTSLKPLSNISYTATTGQYRFHSMVRSKFNRIRLEFYYTTHNNDTFRMYMLPSGSMNVKLMFRPDYEKLHFEERNKK